MRACEGREGPSAGVRGSGLREGTLGRRVLAGGSPGRGAGRSPQPRARRCPRCGASMFSSACDGR